MHGAVCFALYTYTAWTGFLHYYGEPYIDPLQSTCLHGLMHAGASLLDAQTSQESGRGIWQQ